MHNYNVGDLVKVIDAELVEAPAELNGKTGKIATIFAGHFDVEFADGNVWSFEEDAIRPACADAFIVIDEDDNVTAEWRSLEDAERDAHHSAVQTNVGFAVYQRIVSFGVKTEVVETRG